MNKNKITQAMMASVLSIGTSYAAFAEEEKSQKNGIEVIEVTATKRVTTVQDIPMAVEVVSGDSIDQKGIRDLTDLSNDIPSFTVSNSAGNKTITMRGMGSAPGQRGTEQAVAMFVDGVYKPRAEQYITSFLDVERVEILRGPQAVLFGINATAGAISILTRTNDGGDDLEGSIKIDYDTERGGTITTGAVGVGLTDDLGARLVLKNIDTNGFLEGTDDRGDTKGLSGRLTLNYTPSDAISVLTKFEFFEEEMKGQSGEGIDPAYELPDNIFSYQTSTPSGDLFGFNNGQNVEGINFSTQLDYELGEHTLTASFSYSDFDAETNIDFDGGSGGDGALIGNIGEEALSFESIQWLEFEQSFVEFRIASPIGQFFEYIAGASFLQAETVNSSGVAVDSSTFNFLFWHPGSPLAAFGGSNLHTWDPTSYNNPFGASTLDVDQEVMSLYLTTTFNFSDDLHVNVGARYNDETKDATRGNVCGMNSSGKSGLSSDTPFQLPAEMGGFWMYSGACAAAGLQDLLGALSSGSVAGGAFMNRADTLGATSIEESNFLPELSLHYSLNNEHKLFARIAKAAKSGGLASSYASTPENSKFDKETVLGIEFGIKSRVMEGMAEINVTAFNNKYKDLQVSSFEFGTAKVDNAGEATIAGIEADGKIMVSHWLTLGASVAFLDAEYDEYETGTCASPSIDENGMPDYSTSPSVPNVIDPVTGFADTGAGCNMTGLPPINAPKFSGNLFADVFTNLSDNIDLYAGMNISFSDEYYTETKYIAALQQESYSMIGAYIGISDVDEKWSVTLSGRNLTDEILIGSGVQIDSLGLQSVVPTGGAPRTIMLSGQYNF